MIVSIGTVYVKHYLQTKMHIAVINDLGQLG